MFKNTTLRVDGTIAGREIPTGAYLDKWDVARTQNLWREYQIIKEQLKQLREVQEKNTDRFEYKGEIVMSATNELMQMKLEETIVQLAKQEQEIKLYFIKLLDLTQMIEIDSIYFEEEKD